jgi:uncharacterized repeat protein (TIGR03803 family)
MSARRLPYLTLISAFVFGSLYPAHAQTETVLYKFTGTRDENNTLATLVASGGKLYGTVPFGGEGYGIVYELSPNGSGGWTETTIHSFSLGVSDGYRPNTLTTDGKGNLFGTTLLGGANGDGICYELSPAGDSWVETILFSFGVGSAGKVPFGNLIVDAQGTIFGTDDNVTTAWYESVYEASLSDGYVAHMIYTTPFVTASGGNGGLAMDASGNIFGISVQGYLPQIATAFELSPNGNGGWNSNVLYTFRAGIEPESSPTLDKLGRIYGTTTLGGINNNGTVYRLNPGADGQWTRQILYSFKGGKTDGSGPYSAVVFDASGNMYGTTSAGGAFDKGTVFELSPVGDGRRYQETILWSFNGADGNGPVSALVRDSAGNLYGTTPMGGDRECGAFAGCGLAFEVVP